MSRRSNRHDVPWVWAIALSVVVLLLVLSGRYGYHRDELYFIQAGERPAWGYVDQPPFTPLIARFAGLFDHALFALRLLPALSIGAIVVYAGGFARRFGGKEFSQVLAALAVATAGIFLAIGHLLSTTTFDVLIWVVLVDLVSRITQTEDARLWLPAGAVAGIGLLNKWSVLFLAGALGLGLLATDQRRLLRTPLFLVGVGIALLMWLPNFIWQAQNDWPFFEMAESLHAEGVEDGASFLFLPMQVLLIGPLALPIWVAGLRSFVRDERMRPYRFVAWAYLVLVIVFIALSSKPYFITPLYVPLLGAGSVVAEMFVERSRRSLTKWRIAAAVTLAGLVALPIGLPLLPPRTLAQTPLNEINEELGETFGWRSLALQVDSAYEKLPEEQRSETVVFTLSYGEAGAIDLYGPQLGLPRASSGHNNYWLWGPPDGEPVLIVGYFSLEYLESHFVGVRRVGTITNGVGLENEEQGAPIWIADRPRGSWAALWPALRHYN
ncbi:glycosyltransferase family 39 protein [soil metagenome]